MISGGLFFYAEKSKVPMHENLQKIECFFTKNEWQPEWQ